MNPNDAHFFFGTAFQVIEYASSLSHSDETGWTATEQPHTCMAVSAARLWVMSLEPTKM